MQAATDDCTCLRRALRSNPRVQDEAMKNFLDNNPRNLVTDKTAALTTLAGGGCRLGQVESQGTPLW
jgi:hypothetical protein